MSITQFWYLQTIITKYFHYQILSDKQVKLPVHTIKKMRKQKNTPFLGSMNYHNQVFPLLGLIKTC